MLGTCLMLEGEVIVFSLQTFWSRVLFFQKH